MNWLRLYNDINWDRKLRRHPPAIRWAWVTMLCIARRSSEPGYLLIGDQVAMSVEDLADEAAISIDEAEQAIRIFKDGNHRMLADVDGVLYITNWKKRQMESDSSTERVRRYRQKQNETLHETKGNVTETPPDTETDPDQFVVVNQDKTPLPPQEPAQVSLAEVFKAYEDNISQTINDTVRDDIVAWIEQDKTAPELIIEAMKESHRNKKRFMGYVRGILRRWRDADVNNLDDLEQYRKNYEQYQAARSRGKPNTRSGTIKNNGKVVGINGTGQSRGDPSGDPIPIAKLIIRADPNLPGVQTGD